MLFEARFQAAQISTVWSPVGSDTSIFWKRRDGAWSFSDTPGTRCKSLHRCNGAAVRQSRRTGSINPAYRQRRHLRPMSDVVSSMNGMAWGFPPAAFTTPSGAARNRRGTWFRARRPYQGIHGRADRISGAEPSTTRFAGPSAIAVLPTASPTSSGLFLPAAAEPQITRSNSGRGRSTDRSCR